MSNLLKAIKGIFQGKSGKPETAGQTTYNGNITVEEQKELLPYMAKHGVVWALLELKDENADFVVKNFAMYTSSSTNEEVFAQYCLKTLIDDSEGKLIDNTLYEAHHQTVDALKGVGRLSYYEPVSTIGYQILSKISDKVGEGQLSKDQFAVLVDELSSYDALSQDKFIMARFSEACNQTGFDKRLASLKQGKEVPFEKSNFPTHDSV